MAFNLSFGVKQSVKLLMVSAGDEHNFGDLLDKTIDATGDLERNTSI